MGSPALQATTTLFGQVPVYWDTNHQTQAPSISDFENEIETASSVWIGDDKILLGELVEGTADGVHGTVGGTAIDGVS